MIYGLNRLNLMHCFIIIVHTVMENIDLMCSSTAEQVSSFSSPKCSHVRLIGSDSTMETL